MENAFISKLVFLANTFLFSRLIKKERERENEKEKKRKKEFTHNVTFIYNLEGNKKKRYSQSFVIFHRFPILVSSSKEREQNCFKNYVFH